MHSPPIGLNPSLPTHDMQNRFAKVNRHTQETDITVELNLDGDGHAAIETPLPFLTHMLEQVARHAGLDLTLQASGDIHVDAHHTVEDMGITLGQAITKALGDKKGIERFGHSYVPLDEALARVVIDCSGRPFLGFYVAFTKNAVAGFEVDLVREFFQGLVNHAAITLHIDLLRGRNTHHQVESIFKAFGQAFRMAITRNSAKSQHIPSTKGVL